MARLVVTGGAGFIGSELVRQLAARGDEVVAVDSLVNGRRENLAGIEGPSVRLLAADVRDRGTMAELVRGADVVFHLACLGVRHSIHSPLENNAVNATATLELLVEARRWGAGRFVYVSSSEVYGTARHVPMSEEHPAFPQTVYGSSKLAGECHARAFFETYGYPTVVVRPFNAYGPRSHHEGDSGEVIPKFLLRALAGRPLVVFGDGAQTRDFTFVEDTARAIALAGFEPKAVGETLNVGSGSEIAIRDLAALASAAAGRNGVEIAHETGRPGDVLRLCADISRARSVLGFEPRVGLEEGLARLAAWYRGLGRTPEELLQEEVVRNWEPYGVRGDA